MSKRMVITIGREFGSGGRIISTKLSERLGIPFYDKDLINLAIEKSGLDKKMIKENEEKAPGFFITPYAPTPQDQIYMAQTKVIKDLYDSGESCIIVGRCANSILEGKEDVLRIFIYAPMDFKIGLSMNHFKVNSPEKVKKELIKADKVRRNYYQYFTEYQWGSKEGFDLMIDSSVLGIDGTVDFLANFIQKKFAE